MYPTVPISAPGSELTDVGRVLLTDGAGVFGQTEIEDLRASVARDHDVVRLQVAMGDSFGVGGGEGFGHLRANVDLLA